LILLQLMVKTEHNTTSRPTSWIVFFIRVSLELRYEDERALDFITTVFS
jgi:hypothetical protein